MRKQLLAMAEENKNDDLVDKNPEKDFGNQIGAGDDNSLEIRRTKSRRQSKDRLVDLLRFNTRSRSFYKNSQREY